MTATNAKGKSTQLVVIGGGPGGYVAAFHAADLGMKVTIVDPELNPGGVCLYRGCIPSKALLHAAEIIREAEHAKNFGIDFGKPKIDLSKLRGWKDDVVSKLTGGVGQLAKLRKVEHIRGLATFENAGRLNIKTIENESYELSFENAIIATGSSPSNIPGISIDSKNVLDSTTALDLAELPGSLLVIGGGYIGLEMGTVYAALGTRVTVVEMTDGILPGADRDLAAELSKRIEKLFAEILLKTKVVDLVEENSGIKVSFESENSEKTDQLFDKVLISIGRQPNSKNLGLENINAETDKLGFIKIDLQRRTAESTVFAIGDVAGEPMLAHKASHEGKVAVEAIAGKKTAFEPKAIPAVVFTDPEIAWCGLTETEAKESGRDVKILKFPWRASGRAVTLDRSDGLTKHIVDAKTGRILGVGIAGPRAGELIAEGVLAIEMAALASDLELTIHPHPTLSETVMEAAEMFEGQSTHYYKPMRK
ncbi:MAG: dihydrolipoyl dehydrogenase [candidate division Zixibacteria bacterium]|nr:dihydrolipoyl dehydrogenase [candidate division Zixibacteria bacterium]